LKQSHARQTEKSGAQDRAEPARNRPVVQHDGPRAVPEKDLDSDAEEFILSWVGEFPLDEPVALVVHLADLPAGEKSADGRRTGRASLLRLPRAD